eukprot:gene10225-8143_t
MPGLTKLKEILNIGRKNLNELTTQEAKGSKDSKRSKSPTVSKKEKLPSEKSDTALEMETLDEEFMLQRANSIFRGHVFDNLQDTFQLGEELGSGAFGKVVLATEMSTGKRYACKTVPLHMISDSATMASILLEAEIMVHVRGHPNVLKIHSFCQDNKNLYVVEEQCGGGDLVQAVTANAMHFTEHMAADVMKAILESVGYWTGKDYGERLRLADFGYACFCNINDVLSGYAGTRDYTAPEVLAGSYGFPSDVWSCGVTMYVMLSGTFPFEEDAEHPLEEVVKTQEPDMSSSVWWVLWV